MNAQSDQYLDHTAKTCIIIILNAQSCLFVCVEVLRPRQASGVMSGVVSLPNHTFTGQA